MAEEHLDPHGFPIEMDRPVIFTKGDLEPNTELSVTFQGKELGFPDEERWYNVPSIYEGKLQDEESIKKFVQQKVQQGFKFPNFDTLDEAEAAASARSKYLGQLKKDQIEKAVEKQRQYLMLQMLQLGRQ
jgi:isocitrate lyase